MRRVVRPSRRVHVAGLLAAVVTAAYTTAHSARAQQDPPTSGNQPAAQNPQGPTFRTGINFIGVDVVVTDRDGRPVDNLEIGDFEVTEAGKPQVIETFRRVSVNGNLDAAEVPQPIRSDQDEEREAARNDVRVFAVFLDDYHVKRASALKMRDQVARFVETQLGPTDMIGVMHPLDPIARVRMTRDHDVIRRAILEFKGRKHDYFPENPGEANCVNKLIYVKRIVEVEHMRNHASFSALKALIMRLGALKDGRKSLVLVSEGYSDSLPGTMVDYAGGLGRGLPPGKEGPGPIPPECAPGARATDLNLDLQEIWDLANRNNVAIYPVDPRGLAASEFGMDLPEVDRKTDRQYLLDTTETLKTLAESTDGRAIVNRNDITLPMKQIVVDASTYYLLGYRTSGVSDGKFHPLAVKVKRSGLDVRHRPGYWAFKPAEITRLTTPTPAPVASPVETALAATAGSRTRSVLTWTGATQGASGTTQVTFVWEPAPLAPGREVVKPARVTLTASTPGGSTYYRGRIPVGVGTSNPGASVDFDATPGSIELRISVEGAAGETIDTEVREFAVPDFTFTNVMLGTPKVFRARTAVELQRLKSEWTAPPAAAREFSRTERLLLRIPAYGPGGTAPAVTAQLLNRAGQVMSEMPFEADTGHKVFQGELPLSNLAPGEYGVQFTAQVDGAEAKEIVAFRVTQ